jgi:membrane fusion protein (multidrug efflux system)
VRVDVFPDKTFSGRIVAIDPSVDVSTRTVKVRATLKNPERQLLPGMFARVDLETGDPHEYLTLPQTAITYNPYGESVFIVTTPDRLDVAAHDQVAAKAAQEKPAGNAAKPDAQTQLVAKQVFVKIGPKRGDQVAILSGIEKNDQVVTSGQLKLKNGAPVIINNSVIPRNDPAPKPQEE